MYATTFSIKAMDDLIKKLRMDIANLKEENSSLKVSGGGGQNWAGVSGRSDGGFRGDGGRGNTEEEEGEGAKEPQTAMQEKMMRSFSYRGTWCAWGIIRTLNAGKVCVLWSISETAK